MNEIKELLTQNWVGAVIGIGGIIIGIIFAYSFRRGSRLPSPWNSLEVVKLLMSSLTPIVIFVVGARITASSARETVERDRLAKLQLIEHEQEAKVVEKRVKLWDELAPRLNDMYAYFMYVGQWKELSAADIVKRKRETDKLVYAYRPFFSDVFFQAYLDFTKASFMPYGEWRKDARLNTSDFMRNDEEKDRFTEEDNRDEIHRAYYGMMKAAAAELGLAVSQPPRPKDPSGDAPR